MKPFKIPPLLILLAVLSSCAYFNTFHNTKRLYKEARKEREKRQGDEPTPTELKKYDETIEKASKVLELYPTSKYVDDSILILGECFYHKGDYIKAQRKFEELITYFSKSDHFDKSKLWLAKTNIKLKEYLSARFILEELLRSEKVKREIRDEAQLLLGDIQFEQKLYDVAADEYQKCARDAGKKEIRAQAYYRLGECQLKIGEHLEAASSFRNALKNSPHKQFEFDAELNLSRALKLSGEYKEATEICLSLLERDAFKQRHGLVKLEIADCIYREGKALQAQLQDADLNYLGKVEKAIDEYKKITLEYKRTDVAAQAYHEMAKIYENDFGDYVTAKEYYEKVKLEFNRSELVPEATQKAKDIGELIRLKNLVRSSQQRQTGESNGVHSRFSDLELLLLEHGVHPELRFIWKKQREEKATHIEIPDSTSIAEDLTNASQAELNTFIVNKLQLAESYLFQFGRLDSALAEYDEIIALFPEHPGTAKALYTKAFIYENEFHNKSKTDSLLYVLIERFPDSPQAQEARKILGILPKLDDNRIALELYKIAENTLFKTQNTRQAIDEFRKVVETYPNCDYAPKALYTIGWIHEQLLFDNETAIVVYNEIKENYPDSQYAKNIEKKLSYLNQPSIDEPQPASPSDAQVARTTTEDSTRTEFPPQEKALAREQAARSDSTKAPPGQLKDERPAPEKPIPVP